MEFHLLRAEIFIVLSTLQLNRDFQGLLNIPEAQGSGEM
jgi:hypothetical protein